MSDDAVGRDDEHAGPSTTTAALRRSRRCTSSRRPTASGCRLTRFQGGTKGPVILTPGFGTSSIAYTIDTTDTNYPEYLYEHGYDVWVLDYRASPAAAFRARRSSRSTTSRGTTIPRPSTPCGTISGADDVQIMAHCVGSLTLLMALSLGLEGRPVVGGLAADAAPARRHPNELRAGIYAANVMDALGIDSLTTEFDDDPSLFERLYDKALSIYPSGEEPCDRPFCRRVMFMYGEVYDHDHLNEATHDHLEEAFGVANIKTLTQITKILREDHAVSFDGDHDYLDGAAEMRVPIDFIHGEHNRLFLPEGSELTYEWLRDANGPELYSRTVIPGYSHMDCFVGQGCRARRLSDRHRTARPLQLTPRGVPL